VHLSGVTVRVGDEVAMGDIIGYSGKTGARGDHLHFELKYGTSLHSPSVPIDELFGGEEPIAGERYASNNYPLSPTYPLAMVREPGVLATESPTPLPPPTATAMPSPAEREVAQGFEERLPQLEGGLALSAATVRAGEPVTATFTILNTSDERLHLSMLGVASDALENKHAREASLTFDRLIILNPGRSYTFHRALTFSEIGTMELFAFALGPDNEWLPLGGTSRFTSLEVEQPAHSIFLPAISSRPSENDTLAPDRSVNAERITVDR
ncbi:MAG: M23 family metallopeptidase, partial [Chloroflexota bacterium]|nr:M23 family metallopeptidase [Chloroflexota bacterium]